LETVLGLLLGRYGLMQRILLIDDDELILMMMRNALENEGYQVFSTADGPQGITIYKEHEPDLVLLDIGLPSMSGLDVLKELRSFDSKARVIIISGYGASESVSSAIRYGAWDFVEKSIPLQELMKKIREALHFVRG
jgi:DNA-binding NtrC family response regulator